MSQLLIEIQYAASGQRFQLKWAPSGFYTNLPFLLDRLERKYPDGKEIPIRYDPRDPENAGVGRAWSAPIVAIAFVSYFWVSTLYGGFAVASFLATSWMERTARSHIDGGATETFTESNGQGR